MFFSRYPSEQNYQVSFTTEENQVNRQFAVKAEQSYLTQIIELTPKTISELTNRILPLPNNWLRHYMRSKLIEHKINPTLVEAWMGHEPIGAEGFGRFSALAVADLKLVTAIIQTIFDQLCLTPLDVTGGT